MIGSLYGLLYRQGKEVAASPTPLEHRFRIRYIGQETRFLVQFCG
ncbi:MAG: hypothetical protein ACRC8Y_15855 [Chroococcales cyanobacterium]